MRGKANESAIPPFSSPLSVSLPSRFREYRSEVAKLSQQ